METHLEAQARNGHNKSHKRELREKGYIPAVVYGRHTGTMSIAVDAKALKSIIEKAGPNTLIDMRIKGGGEPESYKVMVKSLQRDPVRQDLLHADFQQVSLEDRVRATVRLRLAGEAPGVAAGGVLTPLLRRVEVECLPTEIPEAITVDVSGLETGGTVTIGDLKVPEGVRLLEDRHTPVATVAAAEEPPAPAGPAGAEEAAPEAKPEE
ncbi:MAG: 50S ribosomal protein L25 [Firmicutes bacterium]|nr:50S ribosomal protein L25 [Bacillota bacterium]